MSKVFKSKIYFDQYLFIAITLLSIMGLVFLYSASQENFETILKQSFFVVFGLILMFLLSQLDPDFYKNKANLLTLLQKNSYKKGNFQLSSGKQSSHYLNCKPGQLPDKRC